MATTQYPLLLWTGLLLIGAALVANGYAMSVWVKTAATHFAQPVPSPPSSTEDFRRRRAEIDADLEEYRGALAETKRGMISFLTAVWVGLPFFFSGVIVLAVRRRKITRLQSGAGPVGIEPSDGSDAATPDEGEGRPESEEE